MNFSAVKHDLENIRRYLLPIIQADMISYDNYRKSVSWYRRQPGIYAKDYYPLEYQRLIDKRQYSLLLSDLSFFQFFYKFDGNDQLEAAKLSYYPSPIPLSQRNIDEVKDALLSSDPLDHDDFVYNHVERLDELEIDPINTSHLRFDFDSLVTSHEPSHLQFGGVNSLRVPANFYPMPIVFLEMVIGLIPDCPPLRKDHLSFGAGNSLDLSTIGEINQNITLSTRS